MRAAASIGLDALGEDVVAAFNRVRKRAYKTTLYVKLDNANSWLGFGMDSIYMLGVDYTPVYIYFADPIVNNDVRFDTVVQWNSKITGRELMERVADELRRHRRFPGHDLFQPGTALEQLREQVTQIILGQGADAESNA